MTVLGVIGSTALWLLYAWLVLTIISSYFSGRKGYGERVGLATGMIFPPVAILWLLIPAKAESDWKKIGPFGRGSVADELLEDPQAGREPAGGPGPTGQAG